MQVPRQPRSVARDGLAFLLVVLAFVLTGRAGLMLAIPPGYASAIYPPAGVALAALLMGGYRFVPAVWLGAFCLNMWVFWEKPAPLTASLWIASACFATSRALQTAVGLALVRRAAGPEPRLQKMQEILKVLVPGGPVACVISATLGTSVLIALGTYPSAHWPTLWLVWWVGDTVGVLVVLPLTLAACNWPVQAWEGRRHAVLWPLLVCLTGTVLIYLRVSQSEQQRIQAAYLQQAERAARTIESTLIRYLQSAQAARTFMEVADREDPSAFHHFVSGEQSRLPGLRTVAWAPRVTRAQVPSYETQLRTWFGPNAQLLEWDGLRGMQPASPRAEYYPATFIEPPLPQRQGVGVDMMSEPIRRQALLSALARRDLALTERLHLLVEPGTSWSAVAMLPVRARTPPSEVLGVVVAVLRLEDILQQSVDMRPTQELRFTVWDITHPEQRQLLYGEAQPPSGTTDLSFPLQVRLGDRVWELRASVPPEITRRSRNWQTWALLATCLLFSGMLAMLLLDQTGEKARVAALVAERTGALRQREQFLSAVLQSALDGLLTLDEQGRVRSANPAAGRLLGRTAPEWEDMPLTQVLPSLDWPTLRAELDRLPAESPGLLRETRARHKDGTEVPVELALSNASAEGARSYVCLLHDLTERNRVNRMKDEFVSTVSHELRTPLTSVLGSLSLIKRGKLEPELIDKLIDMAENNAQRLLQLINDLLDVDKMEAGQLTLECKPTALVPLLVRSLEENQGYADRFQVSLQLQPSPADGAQAEVDEGRFAQVLNNLLSNAIKFSPAGGTVELGMTVEKCWVELFVRDHGDGIPPEFQPNMFRKFSQADSSDTRRQRGTGLGLYLTHMLVERMKGEIRFVTAQGEGTTFFVRLPRLTQG